MGFQFDKLHPQVKEAVAVWEAFRRLGFPVTDIGAGIISNNHGMINLHHESQIYSVMLGPLLDIRPQQFVGRWREAVLSIIENVHDKVSFETLLQRSQIWGQMDKLVETLFKRGFLTDEMLAGRIINGPEKKN